MTTQTCPTCRNNLPLSQFCKDLRRNNGVAVYCRECRRKKRRAHRIANPELVRTKSLKPRNRYFLARQLAKSSGHEFTLTYEVWIALVSKACTYCGFPLDTFGRGLDRLDNSQGYTEDNVVPCCGPCNRARGVFFSVQEMRDFIGPAIAIVKKYRSQATPPATEENGEPDN